MGQNGHLTAQSRLSNPDLWQTESLINGESVKSDSGSTFAVYDPATGLELDQVGDCGSEETRRAISAAHAAFQSWSTQMPAARAAHLQKLSQLLQDNIEDLSTIITLENGKSLAEARVEMTGSIQQVDWFAGEAIRSYGDIIPSPIPGVRNLVLKQGVGVAALIVPWNFPALMLIRKAAAALAAGATIVVKTPSETPFSALAFGHLCTKAGFPPGVVNVISTAQSSIVGKEMCSNPQVRKISFTGSTGVGRLLAAQSASTLKKCSFELGGNAPFIVFGDADLAGAVESAAAVKFRCSGQVCIASNRILVDASIYDKFAAMLVEKVKTFKVGAGIDADTTHGPMINAKAVKKVSEHVEDAVSQGATLLVGGKPMSGNFFEPTVLTGGTKEMAVTSEESFGPIALLYKFEDEAEALQLANDTEYGLAAYFWTQDLSRAWRMSESLHAGMVGVNGASVAQASAPFGGVNQSGYGREGSRYGLSEYQEIKLIAMKI